jgi:hypothetical protein
MIRVTVLSVVLNVTVPDLVPESSFVPLTVMVPLPVPLVAEIVNHEADFVTVQEVLDVTVTVTGGAIDPKLIVRGLTRSVLVEPAACETDTVLIRPPAYVMVIVALRAAEVFAVTLTLMVAFPVPEVVLTLSHAALSVMLHVQFDEIVSVKDEALLLNASVEGLVFRYGVSDEGSL